MREFRLAPPLERSSPPARRRERDPHRALGGSMKLYTHVRPAVRGGLAASLIAFTLAACSGSVSPTAPAPGGAGGSPNPGGSIPPKPGPDAAATGGAGGGGETPADAA